VIFAGVYIKNPVFLAPMAGWSDGPFRKLCLQGGAGLVYSEMISADGTVRLQKRTLDLARFDDDQRPISLQMFGADAAILAAAVEIISRLEPDFIDLNFGCPARKIVKRGAGAALLKDLFLMQKIAAAAVKATPVPITAKLRSGWDAETINVVQAAQRLQDVGVKAVCVHPRTQTMQFRGAADWRLIAEVKKAVSIPVVGNGDLRVPDDAGAMFEQTNCDAVMIGRAACGNPWIFEQFSTYLRTGERLPSPSVARRLEMCLLHLQRSIEAYGEKRALSLMKKQIVLYLKGLPNAAELRKQILASYSMLNVSTILESNIHSQL
jgi:tRNA-dihydrouridine synthase B